MIRFLTATVLLLVCAYVATAQTSSPTHQHNSTPVIDGAVSPDQIPDSVAYRLCLAAFSVSQSPTDVDLERQQAQVARIGLRASDRSVLVGIISDFKLKYDSLVADYNATATAAAARNENTDGASLMAKLDELVKSTRKTITSQMSSIGVARLQAFVVAEKKNMKVQGE